MNMRLVITGAITALALGAAWEGAEAGSAMQKALDNGATRLTADQIAEQFVGRTGIWISASGDKKIAIYYGRDNDLHAQKIGGGWSAKGYYGIADTNNICISWAGKDKGRLRCFDVLIVNGVVTKYKA
ncbi:MAG: hypothetical protein D6773_11130, partial [Alphaproteobacteria bacterium]